MHRDGSSADLPLRGETFMSGQRKWSFPAAATTASVALAFVPFIGAAGAFCLSRLPKGGPMVRQAVARQLIQLNAQPAEPTAGSISDTNDPCAEYPYLKFLNVSHNNLGGHGPDKGTAELVWQTLALGKGATNMTGRTVDLIAHVVGDYKPWNTHKNGLSGQFGGKTGQFGSFNLIAGSSVILELSFRDHLTAEPLVMPAFAITWYDLDQEHRSRGREQVVARGFKSYKLSAHTEVSKTKLADGSMKFQSSTFGTGDDNPTDPMKMTEQQHNRAVTLEYENVRRMRFTISAESGDIPRFFTFVGRPALECSFSNKTQRQEQLIDYVVLKPLAQGPGMVRVRSPADASFHKWECDRGDLVFEGQPMAEMWINDSIVQLKAPKKGVVVSMQDRLKVNDTIGERLGDGTIAMVGFLPPLPVSPGQSVVSASHGSLFKKFLVQNATFVNKSDPIAVVSVAGKDVTVVSPRDGVVVSTQAVLQEGDEIDSLLMNRTIAVIGTLLPLKTNSAIRPVSCHFAGRFWEWKKRKGDSVNKGDQIAVVKSDRNGSKITVTLTAPKSGVVHATQERLTQGTVLQANDAIATIGPFPSLKYSGTQETVRAPPGSTFEKYEAKVGDYVRKGDPIARVAPVGVRRLAVGSLDKRLDEDDTVSSVVIKSPRDGAIIAEQHLDPGINIDEAIDDDVIAVVGDAVVGDAESMWSWWLLGAVTASLLLLFVVYCVCRPRANEPYMPLKSVSHQHGSSTDPLPEPEEKEGLRLEWQDTRGQRRVIYAKYRPLGIKMQHVCPIVIEDFKFNSYAKQELEMERRWQLLKVADHDMTTIREFSRARDILNEQQSGLPLWPLRFEFEDPNTNKASTFDFKHKPIGIEFTDKAPIRVKKVDENSPAASFKVQKDWVITCIGTQVKARELDSAGFMRLLNEGEEPLDEWDPIRDANQRVQDPGQQ